MGEKGHKTEKRKEKNIELEKDEKEFQKAKKKHKVVNKDRKADEVVDALKTTSVEGEEHTNLRTNLADNLEERKEKKKKHKEEEKKKKKKKKNKEGFDGISSEIENFEDGKRDVLVKGKRHEESCEDIPVENGEEEWVQKKKKKKMEKEDVGHEKELSEERNYLDGQITEHGKLATREKKLYKIRDEAEKGTENGDVAEMNNDKEGGKSKKRKKKREREGVSDEIDDEMKADDEGDNSKVKKKRKRENVNETRSDEEGDKSKKKERKTENCSDEVGDELKANEEGERHKKKKKKKKKKKERSGGNASDEVEDEMNTYERDRSKKKKNKKEDVSNDVEKKIETDELDKSKKNKERKRKDASGDVKDKSDELGKGDNSSKDEKKKNDKAEKQVASGKAHKGKARTEDDVEAIDTFENPTPEGKSKRVSFSDHVDVFLDDNPSGGESASGEGEGLVQGKRFTKEEDELLKQAVLGYIEERNLGDDGLHMVLHCISYPEVKGCWKDISAALPWRPTASVYYRGHILFERDEKRKWTAEEYDYIREFYKEHGADWKKLSTELKKHRFHVKDTWRRIKLANMKKGHWSQEEYQTLFDLVNMDLRMRALEERKSKHGMLRENICWESISDRLATRNNSTCCVKWYNQLTSPMVRQGLWTDTDDYRLVDALSSLDASCMEDVDWDNLLEHREGHICRKRWGQMVKHIGEYGLMSFSEQVECLAKRYSPNCIEAREEFDSKPILP